ncbi:hypothetical protein [Haloferula sp. BvORR071]|uniref:hypothetical protein n=1 Tax=Haloferula sp. BvORR071 TaxID=1396141 RepID=UPI000552A94E|nr:hypothetical protein [Haloferula sp. BvORR071]
MKRPLQILLCFVPAFAVGWMLVSSASTKDSVPVKTPVPSAPNPTDEAMAPLRATKDRWTAIHAAIQLARGIPPRERQAWLDGTRFRHADPLVVQMFTVELEELLFQEDPYALVTAQIAGDKRGSASRNLARLAKLDPEKLIAFGKTAANPDHGRRMIFAAMEELVGRDPATVLKLALEFPPPADGQALSKDMVRLLAKGAVNDPEKLLDLADARGDRWRALLRAAAAQAVVAKDFTSGVKWLAAQPDGGALYQAIFGIGGVSMEESKVNARKIAENLSLFTPDFVASLQRSSFANSWPMTYDMIGSEELWLSADLGRLGFSSQEQGKLRFEAIEAISRRDAAAAIKYLTDPAMGITAELRRALLLGMRSTQLSMGKEIPPEMLAILTEAELTALKSQEAKFQQNQATPKKPLSIPEQFAEVFNEPNSDSMLMRSENWGPDQIQEALTFVRNAKPEVLADMVKRMQHTGAPLLDLSAEIYRLALVNNLATKKVREELIETAIHWGSREPDKASAWVLTLPAGPERLCSIQNIAAQWSSGDPNGAAKWIATLKDPAEAAAAKEAIRLYNEKTKQQKREGE